MIKAEKMKKRLINKPVLTYIQRIMKVEEDYQNLRFNIMENSNTSLSELNKLSLYDRLMLQKYVIGKLNKDG
jgi:hypothetical protein